MTQRHKVTLWVDVEGPDAGLGRFVSQRAIVEQLEWVAYKLGRKIVARFDTIENVVELPVVEVRADA